MARSMYIPQISSASVMPRSSSFCQTPPLSLGQDVSGLRSSRLKLSRSFCSRYWFISSVCVCNMPLVPVTTGLQHAVDGPQHHCREKHDAEPYHERTNRRIHPQSSARESDCHHTVGHLEQCAGSGVPFATPSSGSIAASSPRKVLRNLVEVVRNQ